MNSDEFLNYFYEENPTIVHTFVIKISEPAEMDPDVTVEEDVRYVR